MIKDFFQMINLSDSGILHFSVGQSLGTAQGQYQCKWREYQDIDCID
jgi:hypothetical protein